MSVVQKKLSAPRDTVLAAKRRDEILDKAATFFSDYGYPNADMQSLADELQVGKGTLYRYFPSKEELFFAATDRGMGLLHEYIEEHRDRSADPLKQIQIAIHLFFRFFDEHPQYLELLIQERSEFKDRREPTYLKHRTANESRWEDLKTAMSMLNLERKHCDTKLDDVINNMLYGTLFTNHFARRHTKFEEQADQIVEVIFCGVLSDTARSEFLKNKEV